MDCCNPNGLNEIFRGRFVASEHRAFKRRGPDKRQRSVLGAIGRVEGRSVLDIGCGIGALGLTLLERGAAQAQLVEVSRDALEAAKDLARDRGLEERTRFFETDFAAASGVSRADIVLLDRVVCCYPDVDTLLEKAAFYSKRLLVLTYPKPRWFSKLFRFGLNAGMRLLGRSYRFYLHDEGRIEAAALSAGHSRVLSRSLGVWQLAVFAKASAG